MIIEIVENIDKRMKQDDDYIKEVLEGKRKIDKGKAKRTMIMTPEVFAKVFSPQRVRLILRIERNKISNIYQLAKELGRKYEAVHRDIAYLEGLGIIKLRDKDNTRIPYIHGKVKLPEFAGV
jgi:predicted transcriptional regulator